MVLKKARMPLLAPLLLFRIGTSNQTLGTATSRGI
jgi:hypothetical protein